MSACEGDETRYVDQLLIKLNRAEKQRDKALAELDLCSRRLAGAERSAERVPDLNVLRSILLRDHELSGTMQALELLDAETQQVHLFSSALRQIRRALKVQDDVFCAVNGLTYGTWLTDIAMLPTSVVQWVRSLNADPEDEA